MKISSAQKTAYFGLKIPENFSQRLAKQCVGISLKDAVALEETLKKIVPDTLAIADLYTKSRKPYLFGPRYNSIAVDYERTMPNGNIKKEECGYLIVGKKPFGIEEIVEIIKKQIKDFK